MGVRLTACNPRDLMTACRGQRCTVRGQSWGRKHALDRVTVGENCSLARVSLVAVASPKKSVVHMLCVLMHLPRLKLLQMRPADDHNRLQPRLPFLLPLLPPPPLARSFLSRPLSDMCGFRQVVDLDPTDCTVQVMCAEFFGGRVTMHSLWGGEAKPGSRPSVTESWVLDEDAGPAYSITAADLR